MGFNPAHIDHCEHGRESYLGTVMEDGAPIDVYVYRTESGLIETCCRFGDEPGDYRSGEGAQRGGFRLWIDRPSHWLIASWLHCNAIPAELTSFDLNRIIYV